MIVRKTAEHPTRNIQHSIVQHLASRTAIALRVDHDYEHERKNPGLPPGHSCLMSPAFTGYDSSSCLRYPSVRGAFIAHLRGDRARLRLPAHYRYFAVFPRQRTDAADFRGGAG